MTTAKAVGYRLHLYKDRYSDGTECWVAEHPELPGCASYGATEQEAKEGLETARRVYLRRLERRGITITPPGGVVADPVPVIGGWTCHVRGERYVSPAVTCPA